jgi:hypothetical protein
MPEPRAAFTVEEARATGEALGVTWEEFDVDQFRRGMNVELEHGLADPATNVTSDDAMATGRIARAHLNEFPDYYDRLHQMEAEADAYWKAKGRPAPGGNTL